MLARPRRTAGSRSACRSSEHHAWTPSEVGAGASFVMGREAGQKSALDTFDMLLVVRQVFCSPFLCTVQTAQGVANYLEQMYPPPTSPPRASCHALSYPASSTHLPPSLQLVAAAANEGAPHTHTHTHTHTHVHHIHTCRFDIYVETGLCEWLHPVWFPEAHSLNEEGTHTHTLSHTHSRWRWGGGGGAV